MSVCVCACVRVPCAHLPHTQPPQPKPSPKKAASKPAPPAAGLTHEEVEDARARFEAADQNGGGTLEFEELAALLVDIMAGKVRRHPVCVCVCVCVYECV